MAKYEKNPDDEGKYQYTVCEYGHGPGNGKSRQSVTRHFNKTHAGPEDATEVTSTRKQSEEAPSEPQEKTEPQEASETKEPGWLSMDFTPSEEEEAATVSINKAAKSTLQGMLKNPASIKSEKELDEFFAQQARMLRWVFAGGIDPALEWWARSVTSDADYTIKRTSSDWAFFEEVAKSWLEYRGIQLPITPDFVMLGTVGAFYAPVFVHVRRKRDPTRPSLWKRWRSRRAVRRALKRQEKEEEAR